MRPKDTVNGFIAIAETPTTIGEEINIASQQEISIGQLAREIIDQINPAARVPESKANIWSSRLKRWRQLW